MLAISLAIHVSQSAKHKNKAGINAKSLLTDGYNFHKVNRSALSQNINV